MGEIKMAKLSVAFIALLAVVASASFEFRELLQEIEDVVEDSWLDEVSDDGGDTTGCVKWCKKYQTENGQEKACEKRRYRKKCTACGECGPLKPVCHKWCKKYQDKVGGHEKACQNEK